MLAALESPAESTQNGVDGEGSAGNSAEKAKPAEICNRVNADESFSKGNIVQMSFIEGISADISIRSFEYEGETLVTGDVPGDVLVTVKGGGLTVEGYVAGYAVASGDLTVEGNLQGGMLISTGGDVRVQRVLLGSTLVAKAGNVWCEHLEVKGPFLGGLVSAEEICVAEKVVSAELRSCRSIKAKALESGSCGPTVVCLQKSLTCQDYGRPLDKEINAQQQQVSNIRSTIKGVRHIDRFTRRLIHICHRTALYYLLGGVDNALDAVNLQGLQSKSIYHSQLISVAEGIAKFYHPLATTDETIDEEEVNRFKEETLSSISLIQSDVEAIPDEFGVVHRRYVLDRCHELRAMLSNLHVDVLQEVKGSYLENVFEKTLSQWHETLSETDRDIQASVEKFNLEPEVLERIENEPEALESMLDQALNDKMSSERQSDVQRAISPLIRLLKESSVRYGKSIQQGQERITKGEKELNGLVEALEKDAAVLYGSGVSGSCSVEASFYDRGVILTSSPKKREGFDANMAEVIEIADPIETQTVFVLRDHMVKRQL